jgi:hypothetical protein
MYIFSALFFASSAHALDLTFFLFLKVDELLFGFEMSYQFECDSRRSNFDQIEL